MSATMRAIFVLMSMMMLVNVAVGEFSDMGWRFLFTYNGIYDNCRTMQNGTKEDRIIVKVRQVDVPCLRPNKTIFIEMDDNGKIGVRNLMVITDERDGVLKLTPLNFTGVNVSRPGKFDFNLLLNLTKDDLQGDPTCAAEFVETDKADFFGNWPTCTVTINGTHPTWGLAFTCDHVRSIMPMNIGETRDAKPYNMVRTGDKFPVIDPPARVVQTCVRNENL